MPDIIGYIATVCQADPGRLAEYLVMLAAWNACNTFGIVLLLWRVGDISKALKREWPRRFWRL